MQAALDAANAAWKSGQTTAAVEGLTAAAAKASPADGAKTRLRLAQMLDSRGERAAARTLWLAVEGLPRGADDASRGEAAWRLAHLRTGDEQLATYERILFGGEAVPARLQAEAGLMAAKAVHKRGDLATSLKYYRLAQGVGNSTQTAQAQAEIAGLLIERAKGEGRDPAPRDERALLWEQARAACRTLLDPNTPAAADRRMVAHLMLAETAWFTGAYDECRETLAAFAAAYGLKPEAYAKREERQYVNTARTLLPQCLYAMGKMEEAREAARALIAAPPRPGDEFPNSNGLVLATVVAKIASFELNDTQAAEGYGAEAGRLAPKSAIGIERSLGRRRHGQPAAQDGAPK